MAYGTTPTLGVNLTRVFTPSTTGYPYQPDYAPITLGQIIDTTDGGTAVYVLASDAIAQYDFVGIDENFAAAPLTDAMALDGWNIGVAQVAIASGSYGWVFLRGSNISGRIAASTAVDVALYTSATAGTLAGSSSTTTKIDGLVNVVANTLTVSAAVEVIATYPRSSVF